jgi:dephospho-CoA kinase
MSNWILGLTGGIGSGKTTVANLFAAEGVTVVDADAIARELVAPGQPALQQITAHFGPGVLNATGELDRAALRRLIFSDEQQKQWLNQLLHPLIRETLLQRCREASSAYVILMAPLLFENGLDQTVQRTLCIDVSEQTQIARTCQRDDNRPELVQAIMASQLSRTERVQRSNDKIDNEGIDLDTLRERVRQLHITYLALSAQHPQ